MGEELVVFVQPGASALADSFENDALPDIRALGEELGLRVVTVDVSATGAPEEVGFTPLVVYQSDRGRAVYVGRFNTLDRLENHVRTARFTAGQGRAGAATADAGIDGVVMPLGRAEVVAPLKVTDLAGHPPKAGLGATFASEAQQAIEAGMAPWFSDDDPTRPADARRLFYADFYPHRDADGHLSVSVAVFSQFHCHEPVFMQSAASAGAWSDRMVVFEQAGHIAAQAILDQLDRADYGDGFDPLPRYARVRTYQELGVDLPAPKPGAVAVDPADLTLGEDWAIDAQASKQNPMVVFAFPPPIRGYSGRVEQMHGSLTLGPGAALSDAAGKFIVPMSAVTMGESDLDSYLQSSVFKVGDNPEASFTLTAIESPAGAPEFGHIAPGELVGTFEMLGVSADLRVPVSIEAFVGDDGKPRLSLTGQWRVKLTDFGVAAAELPPGSDDDARATLVYDCRIVLEPAATDVSVVEDDES
ncbi:MAG: YceI family protein [Planctomycetota bacterium]